MERTISSVLGVALLGMLCLAQLAYAKGVAEPATGRITFTGAVVNPTCMAGGESLSVTPAAAPRRFLCSTTSNAGASDTSAYELSVVPLATTPTAGSPLLQYYLGYLPASTRAGAKLVTRTYE